MGVGIGLLDEPSGLHDRSMGYRQVGLVDLDHEKHYTAFFVVIHGQANQSDLRTIKSTA